MFVINKVAVLALSISAVFPAAATAGTFTTLFTFPGSREQGGNPEGPLLFLRGELYGTTAAYVNDLKGNGNVFKINPTTGAFHIVYTFKGGADGTFPAAGVISQNGLLYGTTLFGGGPNCSYGGGCGTVFSVNPRTHTDKILYSFSNGANLTQAGAGQVVYLAGTLYGTTRNQGANGFGSVFSINPTTGAFATLYSFGGAAGAGPNPVLLYHNGLFYGTTTAGGKGCTEFHGCGVVFSIDPSTGAESVLHAFGSLAGGRIPYSNLIYHENALIGDTAIGGNTENFRRGEGVSFSIKARTGHEKVLRTFLTRNKNYSALTLVGNIVYVTLPAGGRNGYGALDQLDLTTGQQTALHTFTGGADGKDPEAPLTFHDGALYGSTLSGGTVNGCVGDNGCGTIFKYVP